tara:strand:+ start:104 stop:328 length:225 start_codon:yes stop_codon:yes gene_type:complete
MQKLINVLAVSSAVVSLTVVGIGGYVYVRKDAIIESIKEKALGSLGGGVTEMIPDMGAPESPAVPPVGLGVPNF